MEEISIGSCCGGTDFAREIEFLVKRERAAKAGKEQLKSKLKRELKRKLNVFRTKILFLTQDTERVPVDYQRTVSAELVAQLTALNNHQKDLGEASDNSLLQENAALAAQLVPKQVSRLLSRLKR